MQEKLTDIFENCPQKIPLKEALKIVTGAAAEIITGRGGNISAAETEEVPLLAARGRIAARDVISTISNPPWDRSTLDGYALFSSGRHEKVWTGSPIPSGADRVIAWEETKEADGRLEFTARPAKGAGIAKRGSDFKRGSVLVKKGQRIGSAAIAMLEAGKTFVDAGQSVNALLLGDRL